MLLLLLVVAVLLLIYFVFLPVVVTCWWCCCWCLYVVNVVVVVTSTFGCMLLLLCCVVEIVKKWNNEFDDTFFCSILDTGCSFLEWDHLRVQLFILYAFELSLDSWIFNIFVHFHRNKQVELKHSQKIESLNFVIQSQTVADNDMYGCSSCKLPSWQFEHFRIEDIQMRFNENM